MGGVQVNYSMYIAIKSQTHLQKSSLGRVALLAMRFSMYKTVCNKYW